ncbi:unnamed protein product [Discosporangium mesarthrocarpum]
MAEEDPNMPKWARDPTSESTPLQTGGVAGASGGHGAVNGFDDVEDSEGEYDSEYSDEDGGRYAGPMRVRRGCLLNTFVVVNAVTVLVAMGVGAAQVIVLVYNTDLSPVSMAIRCYNTLFCFAIIFAELEWTQTVRELSILHAWMPRGIIYSFVGLLTLEEENEKGLELGSAASFVTVIGWIMVSVGVLYFLMVRGIGLCVVTKILSARHHLQEFLSFGCGPTCHQGIKRIMC